MTEARHQTKLFEWSRQPKIRGKYPELKLLHHVPNGGSRNEIEATNLKRQGVKPGVPDLDLPVPRGKYHGLRIEMKTDKGKPTLKQEWWLEELSKQGYFAEVCHGWESAARVIEWYMGLKPEGNV